MKIAGKLTARLAAADRAVALFILALLASVAVAGWMAIHDLSRLGTNGSDPQVLGGTGNHTEYVYARPDLASAAASTEFVTLTFACDNDVVRFFTMEDGVTLSEMSDTASNHRHELIRFRRDDGRPACVFRFKREATRLGDYVARVFGRCAGSICNLPLRLEEGRSCSNFHVAMLDDENWNHGVLANTPEVVLLTDDTLKLSGIAVGDEIALGPRELRVTKIEKSGPYAHLSLSGRVSPEELQGTGGWICRKRSAR